MGNEEIKKIKEEYMKVKMSKEQVEAMKEKIEQAKKDKRKERSMLKDLIFQLVA